jgi:hypothetical protein
MIDQATGHPDDWLVEPSNVTRALLRREPFTGLIADPACGMGRIVEACIEHGLQAVGTDLRARSAADWFRGQHDFLSDAQYPVTHQNIICNPPFYKAKGTEAFIRRALAITPGKVAIFADLRFLAGEKRAEGIYSELPPSRVYVLSPRVSCLPGEMILAGETPRGGKQDWCWMVWDREAPTSHPILFFLNHKEERHVL